MLDEELCLGVSSHVVTKPTLSDWIIGPSSLLLLASVPFFPCNFAFLPRRGGMCFSIPWLWHQLTCSGYRNVCGNDNGQVGGLDLRGLVYFACFLHVCYHHNDREKPHHSLGCRMAWREQNISSWSTKPQPKAELPQLTCSPRHRRINADGGMLLKISGYLSLSTNLLLLN